MTSRDVLAGRADAVAPLLLGAVLSRTDEAGTVSVRLTEVEAYAGTGEDPGSHAHRGMTPRTAVMFGPAGHLYAYFSYGMHVCANIVTGPDGEASGVLMRGGEVVEGEELARSRRGNSTAFRDLARGPARLASALGIPLTDTGADLLAAPYRLVLPGAPAPFATSPRTGVSGPGGLPEFPWRFYLPDEPTVSPYRPAVTRRRPS
ncbi:DNA-3-methyladenine glycosylase [Naasia lichenicola]|uniref:Putative 3-methyladenine DNA glycosylase n=1 Tax=Naasia lichenicola TaxID=2565933 RepID=A0A4S4FPQ9_9MICO|nr:DNA-3-methyladenine glycosylase [Naasia lichenicola]THG32261.1 DNA-3-methyladenine glycosylase [Naasia lichenicola]